MRQFNYFQALYKSFYSKAFYRDVAENWGGNVLLYLLFLLTIAWAVTIVDFQPRMTREAVKFTDQYATQFPELISIKNGVVTTPENRPYLIVEPSDHTVHMIIDTSGHYTKLEPDSNGPQFLITGTQTYMLDHGQVKVNNIPSTLTIDIKPMGVKDWLVKWVSWVWVILFPFLLIFSFLYRLIQSMFYAVIGKLISLVARFHLNYFTIMKLTIVALTPVIILNTVLAFFRYTHYVSDGMYFLLAMVYLMFAMWASKRAQ